MFILSSDVHNYQINSALKKLFHIPRIHTTTYGNKSIKFYVADLWNDTFKNGIAIDNDVKNNVWLIISIMLTNLNKH